MFMMNTEFDIDYDLGKSPSHKLLAEAYNRIKMIFSVDRILDIVYIEKEALVLTNIFAQVAFYDKTIAVDLIEDIITYLKKVEMTAVEKDNFETASNVYSLINKITQHD